jgi:hypothetical protein
MKKEEEGENFPDKSSVLAALDLYITKNLIPNSLGFRGMGIAGSIPNGILGKAGISSYIKKHKNKETFSVMLNRLREERNLEPPELYKAADIDRKLYSRIMGERDYKPSKNTAISFGLALKLQDSEMGALLESAGYILSRSVIFDLVISFCLENMIYTISDVNDLLLARNEPRLQ